MSLVPILFAFFAVPGGRDYYPREYCIVRGGDWDLDGVSDLAVGLNGYVAGPDTLTIRDAGQVHLLSGKDGHLIRTIRGDRLGALFGTSVLPTRDWDADGTPDLWVGAPGHAWSLSAPSPDNRPGGIHLCSGKDGSTLRTFRWMKPREDAGGELISLGDLDGDGCEDLCVGSMSRGVVFAVSSKTGMVLWSMETDRWVHGDRLARVGDLDGDGVGELVVGFRDSDEVQGFYTGCVCVVSGRTGRELKRLRGSKLLPAEWRFSGVLCATGDERQEPVVIAQCLGRSRPDRAAIFRVSILEETASGPLAFTTGRAPGEGDQAASLGTSLCGLPDLDADGMQDFAISAPHWRGSRYGPPWAAMFVVSGKSLGMRASLPGPKFEDCSCFGDEIGDAGDLDSDGVTDIFCTTWPCEDCTGEWSKTLQVCSGRTLKRVWEIPLKPLE